MSHSHQKSDYKWKSSKGIVDLIRVYVHPFRFHLFNFDPFRALTNKIVPTEQFVGRNICWSAMDELIDEWINSLREPLPRLSPTNFPVIPSVPSVSPIYLPRVSVCPSHLSFYQSVHLSSPISLFYLPFSLSIRQPVCLIVYLSLSAGESVQRCSTAWECENVLEELCDGRAVHWIFSSPLREWRYGSHTPECLFLNGNRARGAFDTTFTSLPPPTR